MVPCPTPIHSRIVWISVAIHARATSQDMDCSNSGRNAAGVALEVVYGALETFDTGEGGGVYRSSQVPLHGDGVFDGMVRCV